MKGRLEVKSPGCSLAINISSCKILQKSSSIKIQDSFVSFQDMIFKTEKISVHLQ